MDKYFIDAGYYVGKALEYYAPFLDDSWEVIAFEPNPYLNAEETSKRFPFKVQIRNEAIWIAEGSIDFRIGGRDDASHIDGIRESTDKKITVPAIDFSKFIYELPDKATVVCSFDVEGAEFPILRKMLEEGTASKLTLLDIEFHSRIIKDEDEASVSQLRKALEGEGVLVKLKIEP